tara:strand:- start:125 stop:577 length:453 start_codon:yes stop_codon:yes gene_type:complete
MGLFGKSLKKQLIDLALLKLKEGDQKNFDLYLNELSENKSLNEEKIKIFKDHWKAILTMLILHVYLRLGTEAKVISTGEFSDIESAIRIELGSVEVGILLYDYQNKNLDPSETISKSCFDGKLSQSSKDKIANITQEIYQSLEKSVQVLI